MPPGSTGEDRRVKTLRERCAAIELLVVDVDGVLTAGGIVYGGIAGHWNTSSFTSATAPA